MISTRFDDQVARRTGEDRRTVRALGFGPLRPGPTGLEPEDLVLALDCPFCGRRVAPAAAAPRDGEGPLAGCDHCDVEFAYAESEVYAAPAAPAAARLADLAWRALAARRSPANLRLAASAAEA